MRKTIVAIVVIALIVSVVGTGVFVGISTQEATVSPAISGE